MDLQKHFGFLSEWKVIGPFDNTGNQGFETAYPPELKIDLAAEYDGKQGKVRWQDYVTTHKYGMVDMNQPCGKLKEVTAYATTDFFSDRARAVELAARRQEFLEGLVERQAALRPRRVPHQRGD